MESQPGVGTFLHSESCSIGIAASIPMTLSWAWVQATVNDLVEVCVNNPLTAAIGGRAYYGRQNPVDIGGGMGGGWEKGEEVQKRRHCVECSSSESFHA